MNDAEPSLLRATAQVLVLGTLLGVLLFAGYLLLSVFH